MAIAGKAIAGEAISGEAISGEAIAGKAIAGKAIAGKQEGLLQEWPLLALLQNYTKIPEMFLYHCKLHLLLE
jgi:hypothetical protein